MQLFHKAGSVQMKRCETQQHSGLQVFVLYIPFLREKKIRFWLSHYKVQFVCCSAFLFLQDAVCGRNKFKSSSAGSNSSKLLEGRQSSLYLILHFIKISLLKIYGVVIYKFDYHGLLFLAKHEPTVGYEALRSVELFSVLHYFQ